MTVYWRSYKTVSASCALLIPHTWLALTTSTFPPVRSAASTCVPAIPFRARFDRPRRGERYFALLKVNEINYDRPENAKNKILFENLTPLFAQERLRMEIGNGSTEDLTARVIDLVCPMGKGQRALIVSPPKAGKTLMLQNIANSITRNNPELLHDRAADRRASRGGHRHAAHRARGGGGLHLR